MPRPIRKRSSTKEPFITGQRILDCLFPIARGGMACLPGGFGTGKTVLEQSLAKFSAADVIVYVGCGERGNEMTDVLTEFPHLVDPKTGGPLMDRTVLIVNTSNMPVAAREASIFVGVTIAEYFRDMGYAVAVMVDSTSRWAEALREISSRLEEMPGRGRIPHVPGLAPGLVLRARGNGRSAWDHGLTGSVTIVGAVSPAGRRLLRARHPEHHAGHGRPVGPGHPAGPPPPLPGHQLAPQLHAVLRAARGLVPARTSGQDWPESSARLMEILQKEAELQEVVQLVGPDALQENDRLLLEVEPHAARGLPPAERRVGNGRHLLPGQAAGHAGAAPCVPRDGAGRTCAPRTACRDPGPDGAGRAGAAAGRPEAEFAASREPTLEGRLRAARCDALAKEARA